MEKMYTGVHFRRRKLMERVVRKDLNMNVNMDGYKRKVIQRNDE